MTLREIDDALLAWNNRLAAAASRILELQGDSTYKYLTGFGGGTEARISGVTASRALPALAAMTGIFEQFTLLNSTIEQAGKKRAAMPALFGTEARLQEIEQLLSGKSIRLPTLDDDSGSRSSLGGAPEFRLVTANELLESMTQAFAHVRDTVTAVGKAWDSSAESIAALEVQRDRLTAQWPTIRRAAAPELEEAVSILGALKAQTRADPLGAQGDLRTRVEPLLGKVQSQVDAAERLRHEIQGACVQLENLRVLHHETCRTRDEVCARIAGCDALPQPIAESRLVALDDWLQRLDSKRLDIPLEAISVGLRNWERAAEGCVAEESAACTAAKQPIEERGELRGRLDALQAKARAYGLAEGEALKPLAQRAEAVLYHQPTDLVEAGVAVARYEETLIDLELQTQRAAREGARQR